MMCTNKESFERNNEQEEYFSALLEGRQISLNLDILHTMLTHELGIDVNILDEQLATVLPYMLAFYIKNWPGWQINAQGRDSLNYTLMFKNFREYLRDRLDFLIKKGYDQIKELENADKTEQTIRTELNATKGIQSEDIVQTEISSFSIHVNCPAKVMESVLFADWGNDIIMGQAGDIPWEKITVKELLNWPHVSVNFISPELSFKRKNCSKFIRYLSLNNGSISPPDNVNFIEQINILDSTVTRTSFTLEVLNAYANEYVHILKNAKQVKNRNVIELLLKEFLADVKEIEMNNTMATNTSVRFNIGKSTFIRSKAASVRSIASTVVESKPQLCYLEFYVPKMETTLFYFKGVQDIKASDISFVYFNKCKSKKTYPQGLKNIIPTLLFTCEYCNVVVNDSESLMKHLEDCHTVELSYKCRVCKADCSIRQLSAQRWKHVCKDRKHGITPSTSTDY